MKSIKNILAIPPTKSSFIGSSNATLCQECRKRFRPTRLDQVYCSVNCERTSSWMELNEQHRGMQQQRCPRTTRSPRLRDLDDVIREVIQSSSSRSTYSSSIDISLAGPSTPPPSMNKPIFRTPSSKVDSASPRCVLRKRRPTSLDHSCAVLRYIPSEPSSTSSSPLRTSYATSVSSSESNAPCATSSSHYPDSHISAHLSINNLSSPALLPPRPRFTSSMASNSRSVKPFLTRKPSHPVRSTVRPTPTRAKTALDGQAPSTAACVATFRPGFDRRGPRPRSNSFGGFDSLAMHVHEA